MIRKRNAAASSSAGSPDTRDTGTSKKATGAVKFLSVQFLRGRKGAAAGAGASASASADTSADTGGDESRLHGQDRSKWVDRHGSEDQSVVMGGGNDDPTITFGDEVNQSRYETGLNEAQGNDSNIEGDAANTEERKRARVIHSKEATRMSSSDTTSRTASRSRSETTDSTSAGVRQFGMATNVGTENKVKLFSTLNEKSKRLSKRLTSLIAENKTEKMVMDIDKNSIQNITNDSISPNARESLKVRLFEIANSNIEIVEEEEENNPQSTNNNNNVNQEPPMDAAKPNQPTDDNGVYKPVDITKEASQPVQGSESAVPLMDAHGDVILRQYDTEPEGEEPNANPKMWQRVLIRRIAQANSAAYMNANLATQQEQQDQQEQQEQQEQQVQQESQAVKLTSGNEDKPSADASDQGKDGPDSFNEPVAIREPSYLENEKGVGGIYSSPPPLMQLAEKPEPSHLSDLQATSSPPPGSPFARRPKDHSMPPYDSKHSRGSFSDRLETATEDDTMSEMEDAKNFSVALGVLSQTTSLYQEPMAVRLAEFGGLDDPAIYGKPGLLPRGLNPKATQGGNLNIQKEPIKALDIDTNKVETPETVQQPLPSSVEARDDDKADTTLDQVSTSKPLADMERTMVAQESPTIEEQTTAIQETQVFVSESTVVAGEESQVSMIPIEAPNDVSVASPEENRSIVTKPEEHIREPSQALPGRFQPTETYHRAGDIASATSLEANAGGLSNIVDFIRSELLRPHIGSEHASNASDVASILESINAVDQESSLVAKSDAEQGEHGEELDLESFFRRLKEKAKALVENADSVMKTIDENRKDLMKAYADYHLDDDVLSLPYHESPALNLAAVPSPEQTHPRYAVSLRSRVAEKLTDDPILLRSPLHKIVDQERRPGKSPLAESEQHKGTWSSGSRHHLKGSMEGSKRQHSKGSLDGSKHHNPASVLEEPRQYSGASLLVDDILKEEEDSSGVLARYVEDKEQHAQMLEYSSHLRHIFEYWHEKEKGVENPALLAAYNHTLFQPPGHERSDEPVHVHHQQISNHTGNAPLSPSLVSSLDGSHDYESVHHGTYERHNSMTLIERDEKVAEAARQMLEFANEILCLLSSANIDNVLERTHSAVALERSKSEPTEEAAGEVPSMTHVDASEANAGASGDDSKKAKDGKDAKEEPLNIDGKPGEGTLAANNFDYLSPQLIAHKKKMRERREKHIKDLIGYAKMLDYLEPKSWNDFSDLDAQDVYAPLEDAPAEEVVNHIVVKGLDVFGAVRFEISPSLPPVVLASSLQDSIEREATSETSGIPFISRSRSKLTISRNNTGNVKNSVTAEITQAPSGEELGAEPDDKASSVLRQESVGPLGVFLRMPSSDDRPNAQGNTESDGVEPISGKKYGGARKEVNANVNQQFKRAHFSFRRANSADSTS